jgi:cardiolipin synthase A/B
VFALVTDRWYWAIVTGLMGLVSYLMTPSEFAPRYGLDHELSVTDDEFVQTVVGATGLPLSARNSLTLLNNGDEFYPAMLEDIGKAEASITIEAYIYWSGQIGLAFARALAAKSKAGVNVKILLDAIGSASIGEEILQTLEDGRCELAWYNPIHWYSLGRFNHRTHRKSLIVDGKVGFTGGAGIADHWLGNAEDPRHWRDIQIRVEGPAIVPLQTGFAQNWLQTTHELISGPLYFPAPVPAGPLKVQTIMSSPEAGASSVRILYYLSIICARRSIFIANPYFIPDQSAIDILIEAKQRGVDVRIMVSGVNNDNWLARHNSVRLFRRLLEGGIEIHEYNRTMLHHKTMVVDNIWATVGTTNFDNRSFAHNEETNVCVYDRDVARVLRQVFMTDLEACARVELRTWRRRGLWAKTQEVIASVLQEQI